MQGLKDLLLALGIPGVMLIAALDSAGFPMPGGPDAVVMLVAWQRPVLAPIVALAAAVGSTLGCYLLYLVGRKSGNVALGRFDREKVERVKERLKRNDWLAVLIAVIGPPPFPTKIFILAAGAIRMSWRRFFLTVFAGRIARYLLEAYLGARFGERAAGVIRAHHTSLLLGLLIAAALFLLVRRLKARAQADPA